jgi:hypothetical protein
VPVNNLPLPYADELLYGLLARAKVHLSLLSPKKLLRAVYGHSGMIASMRFGSNLSALVNSYDYPELSNQTLLYKHTLWPLLSPFIPLERKQRCESWLLGQRDKAVTVASGLAASRLKYPQHLRYCPLCVCEQIDKVGEAYWLRLHQVPAIDVCLKHKCCLKAHSCDNLQRHQHEFFPVNSTGDSAIEQVTIAPFFRDFNHYIVTLLNLEVFKNPSYAQWSAYYRSLATSNGLSSGQNILHEEIKSRVMNQFPLPWLSSIGLPVNGEQTNWTRAIFRKHRKSFSFVEHYIINHSLMSSTWDVEKTLNEVSRYNRIRMVNPKTNTVSHSAGAYEQYRQDWQRIVMVKGVKQARKACGAVYAWLYRHDKRWLLSINADYRVKSISSHQKVDWHKRDKSYARMLINIIDGADTDIHSPQRTKNWLLTHFSNKHSLEKWLPKLSITNKLLEKYAETTPEYQIRRITRSLINGEPRQTSQLWYLMRASGLSKERLTPLARQFIKLLLDHSIVSGPTTSIEDN